MFEKKIHHATAIKIRVEKKIVIVVCKIVKKRKRFAELIRRSRDAFRARIMTNSSINVTLIAINMTK
jgi:hypothetical protein